MKKEKVLFEQLAARLIDHVLALSSGEHLFKEFCSRDPKARKLGGPRFSAEYLPALLALGCKYWKSCCEAYRIEDKGIENIFFKTVIKRFDSPDALATATRFSECLYASNAAPEDSPVLAIAGHLFSRLDLDRSGTGAGEGAIAPGFVFLIEACEAFKDVFEREFDDFIYAADDFRV